MFYKQEKNQGFRNRHTRRENSNRHFCLRVSQRPSPWTRIITAILSSWLMSHVSLLLYLDQKKQVFKYKEKNWIFEVVFQIKHKLWFESHCLVTRVKFNLWLELNFTEVKSNFHNLCDLSHTIHMIRIKQLNTLT